MALRRGGSSDTKRHDGGREIEQAQAEGDKVEGLEGRAGRQAPPPHPSTEGAALRAEVLLGGARLRAGDVGGRPAPRSGRLRAVVPPEGARAAPVRAVAPARRRAGARGG